MKRAQGGSAFRAGLKHEGEEEMKAVLVFLDGTVCDMRHRISLQGKEAFFAEENVLRDVPTQGSVDCMRELSERYHLIYIGARPERAADCTI